MDGEIHCEQWWNGTRDVARLGWCLDTSFRAGATCEAIHGGDDGFSEILPEEVGTRNCLSPIALAEVLINLAESCVHGQHIAAILARVETKNLGPGPPDAAAMVVRCVEGWIAAVARTSRSPDDVEITLLIDWEASPQLPAVCATQWVRRNSLAN